MVVCCMTCESCIILDLEQLKPIPNLLSIVTETPPTGHHTNHIQTEIIIMFALRTFDQIIVGSFIERHFYQSPMCSVV